MHILNSRMLAFAALACVALAATPAAAEGIKGGSDRGSYPAVWHGLYGGVHLGASTSDHDDGLVAGAQVGYNWNWNSSIVYGLEADISVVDGDIDWLASIRGRAGYLIDPRLLAYATLGFGFANDNHGTESDVVFGLGVEGRINPNTTLRLEYLTYGDLDVNVVRAGINFKLGR
jgi:outer membrane immunogenic protein